MLLCARAFHAQSEKTCAGWNLFGGLPYRFETLYPKSSYARTRFTGLQVSPAFARSFSVDGLR
jgi:hypothetical protein